jgi:hypothetical protein
MVTPVISQTKARINILQQDERAALKSAAMIWRQTRLIDPLNKVKLLRFRQSKAI